MAAISTVSRVAFLASDIVLHSQPSGSFAESYKTLSDTTRSRRPSVQSVPAGGDPGVSILRLASGASLASFTSSFTSQSTLRLVLLAAELSSLPLVLHIAVQDDLSDVLLLQSAFPFFVISYTPQEAHDNALLASRLARAEKKAVVHVFYELADGPVVDIAEEDVQPFLLSEKVASGTNVDTPEPISALYQLYGSAALSTSTLTRRPSVPLTIQGDGNPDIVVFVLGNIPSISEIDGVSFVSIGLLAPLSPSHILRAIPPSASHVLVLEQLRRSNTKWTPLYLDIVDALQERQAHSQVSVQSVWFTNAEQLSPPNLLNLVHTTSNTPISSPLHLQNDVLSSPHPSVPHVPKHESSYTKILSHIFGPRLEISNSPELVPTEGNIATSPEYALGRIRGQLDQRAQLIDSVQTLMEVEELSTELHRLLAQWLQVKDDGSKSRAVGAQATAALESSQLSNGLVDRILALKAYFPSKSRWILGSDAWAYDLGSSGLHHAIASGLDINILILDTLPYSSRNATDPHRRKQDVGLYAMNHGDVYVASIAVYSSYAQALQAVMEADRHKGPSVVLAYLPYDGENSPALELLKETKLAVDSGYWPLYRWDPVKEARGEEPFILDSDAVKNDLQQFLDRKNHLSQLVRSKPQIATELVSSLGESVKEARRRKAQQAYDDLLVALDAPPLLVLYASDGGTAEKHAKKLVNRAKARGMTATIGTLDSMTIQSLAQEEHVAFVTSVAGQGEPPQNGRQLFKALNAATQRNEKPFSKLRYTVFGLGDSHYWPRPEDAHYYNKPGKDLDLRLEQLGGERFVDLGLGDDQDADGPQTGYKVWEPKVWKALGVDSVQVTEAEPEPITNEHIKAASEYLRGTIAEGLEDTTTGALAPSDTQLTKFHGIYQQDDRDIRDERQAQGVEPAYSFMIRVRTPGGVCTPEQWLQMDQISDEHANGTLKITTRSTFQFHGVIKRHLKPSIQKINRVLMDTLAACGDVNRNVICSAIPSLSKLHHRVYEFSKLVSSHLLPRTTAYHEIWLDKKMVAGEAVKDFEPLYGEFYLPRKFKIAVAVPPYNDVDIFANDLGFIAIVDEDGDLEGFNVTLGGGMGVTHGNKKTYPRIADVIGFCTVEQGPLVAEKVMLTQRDNGNRVDRKNARLKYTVDRMGLDNFKREVEDRLGFDLAPARPYSFESNIDHFGWTAGEDGRHHVTIYIENGRVQDEPGKEFKTGLREIAKVHKGTFRMTANQHLLVSEIPPEEVPRIKALLAEYKLDNVNYSGLRLSASACVAFPTCGLAMAESERYLPVLVDKVEKICEENGLRHDSIVMRMTGCPNGCARPYVAEVAFVGKAPGSYAMLLGGGYYGQRLNKIYRETVSEPEILAILKPMIKRYALERHEGERFGDFVIRAGYIAPTTEGKLWYDRMGGEGEHREISTV
ncbi:sulphite reductase hemo protein, beta subunit [Imleria badia]|nr:sulphite reductase hemo protein, beta subunit [Imleria badia]